eukprot:3134625-Karenia_brevis.AAC.1
MHRIPNLRSKYISLCGCESKLYLGIKRLQQAVDKLVSQDRVWHISGLASVAQHAAAKGDHATTFAIARSLAGRTCR